MGDQGQMAKPAKSGKTGFMRSSAAMDTPTFEHLFPIESFATPLEDPAALRAELNAWYQLYQPSTPGECTLLDMAVMAGIDSRRARSQLAAIVADQVRTAIYRFDCAQEDEVARYQEMWATAPAAAILGLKRSALGCRFLISHWSRLLTLICEEKTWFGADRDRAILLQGGRPTLEELPKSEAAYLTYLYCLMAQPRDRTDADFLLLDSDHAMPESCKDRQTERWLGPPEVCRAMLRDKAEREIAKLRVREELLRTHFEAPARDESELRRQVLESPQGMQLQRQIQMHDLAYHRAYNAFVAGRRETARTGKPAGMPQNGVHQRPEPTPGAPTARPGPSPEECRQASDALAANEQNGFGLPEQHGDQYRRQVMAALKERVKASPEEAPPPLMSEEENARRIVSGLRLHLPEPTQPSNGDGGG
jgi:hypothetical protein